MKNRTTLLRGLARTSLVCSLLVVVAGSVVRMTGSGMGCPDWPKCFGYLIPPTNEEQVRWKPDFAFQKGQMIVQNEQLWVAKASFTTGEVFSAENWQVYDKHDYAIFNAFHTWTEYINRLIGAFTGLPVLLLFAVSLTFRKSRPVIPVLAGLALFMLGFEAWLGKLVVDGNLIPMQITIHMFGALVLIAVLLLLLQWIDRKPGWIQLNGWNSALVGLVTLTLVQIFMGTIVREEVDILLKDGVPRFSLIGQLPDVFKLHRSFSIAVLLLNALFLRALWKQREHEFSRSLSLSWAALLTLEVLWGVGLVYLDFPRGLQPLHLLTAVLLFAVQWSFFWRWNMQPITEPVSTETHQ